MQKKNSILSDFISLFVDSIRKTKGASLGLAIRQVFLIGGFILTTFFIGLLVLYISIIFAGNYAIDNKKLVMDSTTTLVDKNGEVITKLFKENREIVPLSTIPEYVHHAFIAMEDARFYDHQGIDIRAIGRALYRDIVSRSKVEGGSTITQQLVKNTFLTSEKTWLRKTKEVVIAISLERKFNKEEILEMYLNRIYFGHGAYGVQAASKLYFNKDVSELSVDEGALLASLPKAPNTYSPFNNPTLAKERRDLTLSVMEKRGYLTAEEAVRLQGRLIKVDDNKISDHPAYLTYIDMVLNEAANKYQLSNEEILRGGYTIVVPMDKSMQQKMHELFQDNNFFPEKGPNQLVQGAAIFLDNDTGGVRVAQGGRDYVRRGLNRVNIQRQPGSTVKPLVVYTPALESGLYHPYSLLQDNLIEYNGYQPRNYPNQYEGMLTMYDAVRNSSNAAAVWLLNELSVETGKEYLHDLGIQVDEEGLALALGGMTNGLTPLQLATAYRPFIRDGKKVEPYFIEAIYDRHGEEIVKKTVQEEQVISAQTAWYITKMLEAVVKEGTGQAGNSNVAVAGKTGTTTFEEMAGAKDIWFTGFTPEVVGAIWMGFDKTDRDHYLKVGSSYPTKLFKEIVNDHVEAKEFTVFQKPDNVVDLERPVRLVVIDDLQANVGLRGFNFTVDLQWSTQDDERIIYHIYEIDRQGFMRKVDQVQGLGQYSISGINIFSLNDYVVKPFNPQTNIEGEQSNIAKAKFNF